MRLVNRYRYRVFGLCLGYTGDFDSAEDAAQEAFVAAYLGLHSLADPTFFGPWLKRIAINQCRMQWRRAQRWRPLGDAPDEALHTSDLSPDVMMVDAERRAEVLEAIGRLAESQRQVLVLFYLEEMPLRRIAAFLSAQFERALRYYAKEEDLLGKLEMHGPIYRVGTLAGLGRVDKAIEKLSEIAGRLVATGQWRTTFESHQAFDAIRDHEKVKAIMVRWQEAEAVGKHQAM